MPEYFFTISTAGHVDHGKTSVIKRLTGIDPDRLKEEKQRQMTTDLGFAHKDLAPQEDLGKEIRFRVGFIDVPGHGKFLKNMLAGVGGLDMALLVVAADEGVKPQTIQHAEILSLLGIKNAVVVLTKIDLTDRDTIAETKVAVEKLLSNVRIDLLAVTPVSCSTGEGFVQLECDLSRALALNLTSRLNLPLPGAAYLPVDRAFHKTGFGLVITGTLTRGKLRSGQSVYLYPSGAKARIRGLETFGKSVVEASPGQRLAVNLALKDSLAVGRGTVVSSAELNSTKTILVSLRSAYEDIGKIQPLTGRLRLYHGTAEYGASFTWWQKAPDKTAIFAQLKLDEVFFGRPGEAVVLRQSDESILGASILTTARYRWLTRENAVAFLQLLNCHHFDRAIAFAVESSPDNLFSQAECVKFLPPDQMSEYLASAKSNEQLREIAGKLTTEQHAKELEAALLAEAVTAIEKEIAEGREGELSIEHLRTTKFPRLKHQFFLLLIEQLQSDGHLVRRGEKIAVESFEKISKGKVDQALLQDLRSELAKFLCIETASLLASVKDTKESRQALLELEKMGELRIVAREFVASTTSIAHAHKILSDVWREKKQISPSDFKEALGVTRKYAMALLSFFDDELITRRLADRRVLLKEPKIS